MLDCPLKYAASSAIAWIGSGSVWTYRDLDALADRCAESLRQQGVKPGFRIAFSPHPTPLTVALLFAAWRLGASLCPLHLRLTPEGREALLQRLQPDLLLPEDFSPGSAKASLSTIDASLPALFLMTSGSTAEPKIAVLTVGQLLANAAGAISVVDLRPGDSWLLQLPLFHVGGLGIILRCIFARAAIITDPTYPFITHISSVPTQLYRASPIYKTLKCLLLGGAPIASYPKQLPIVATYGLTEMGSMVLAQRHPIDGYLGFPLPKRVLRLAPDGEILARGECLFAGYWQNGQIIPPDSWFATKDIGCVDPEKGFKILGRKDWQFISGGENIQPEEIEQYLLQIPGVHEAIVASRPDPEFGARSVAFVVGTLDLSTMQHALSAHLPRFKIPKELFLLDHLPKNGLKVDRRAISQLYRS